MKKKRIEIMNRWELEQYIKYLELETGGQTFQGDVFEILEALNLGVHARPKSCHQVVQDEIIPEIKRIVGLMEFNKNRIIGTK